MTVLVDTTVLSLALRQRPQSPRAADRAIVDRLVELVKVDRAAVIGVVRQETLSGLRSLDQFHRLQRGLDGYQYLPTALIDHDAAAKCYNLCIRRGITPGAIDMLLCATAIRHAVPIFTVDTDFNRYASILPIQLFDFTK